MQIRLNFPPGTEARPILDDSKTMVGVEITPFFPSRRAVSAVCHGESVNKQGSRLGQFIMSVSGGTGLMTFRRRDEAVVPLVDMTEEERAKLRGPDDDEEEEDADAERTSPAKRS